MYWCPWCPWLLVKVIMPPPPLHLSLYICGFLPVLPSHKAALDLHFRQGNWSIWLLPYYNSTPPPSLPYPAIPPIFNSLQSPFTDLLHSALHFLSLSLTKRLISAGNCYTSVHESTCGSSHITCHSFRLRACHGHSFMLCWKECTQ